MHKLSKKKFVVIGVVSGLVFLLLFGGITAIVSNPWFTRMIPTTPLDWFFLAFSSLLIGAYTGVHFYKKKTAKTCNAMAVSGGAGSFFAFACPICNKLLVVLFGATALMSYFEPYRPVLGLISNGLLTGALYWRVRT